MATLTLVRKVNLPVEKVWSLIGDFTASPGPDIKVEVNGLIDAVEKYHT